MFKEWILALDFDGTCWDSLDERFYTTNLAFVNLYGRDCQAAESAFKRGTAVAAGAADFYWVMQLALESRGLDWDTLSDQDLARYRQDCKDPMMAFEAEFYRIRGGLQRDHFTQWAGLQRPYPHLVAQFGALQQAFREVVVATAKDAASAAMLLATADLKSPILGREHGIAKGPQLLELCRMYDISPGQVIFIDDLLANLLDARTTGAHCFLAGWGYNTPATRARARLQGIDTVELSDLLRQLEIWHKTRVEAK